MESKQAGKPGLGSAVNVSDPNFVEDPSYPGQFNVTGTVTLTSTEQQILNVNVEDNDENDVAQMSWTQDSSDPLKYHVTTADYPISDTSKQYCIQATVQEQIDGNFMAPPT